ncbi:hypothetical protein TUN199_11519 [Pyrenophora tritici-repentis]|nr:hypothetical protein Alg215_11913 [Pyrenophora tritici-repentis]KAI0616488.1 hypothetical protein TUN199_11519 [Pyrenophora tritici-repentis]
MIYLLKLLSVALILANGLLRSKTSILKMLLALVGY